jgi:hypothetical protein
VVERRPLVHYLYWEWSELSPAFVDDSNSRMPPHLWAQNEIVRYILLPTTIPFGDIMRLFGEPDAGLFTVSRYQNRTVFATNTHHTAAYYGARFVIDTDVYCPVEPSMFWNAPSTISYYAFPNARDRMRDYDLHSWLYTGDCARRSR